MTSRFVRGLEQTVFALTRDVSPSIIASLDRIAHDAFMAGDASVQRTFFDVDPNDIKDLAPGEAVLVLREMLWADAFSLGIPVTNVDVPFAITDPDGGIDATVDHLPDGTKSALIRPPLTCYQVKTGGFSLRSNRDIEALLMLPASIQGEAGSTGTKKSRFEAMEIHR